MAVEETRCDNFPLAIQLIRPGIAADPGNLLSAKRNVGGIDFVAEDVDNVAAILDILAESSVIAPATGATDAPADDALHPA